MFTEREMLDKGYKCESCKTCNPTVKRLQVYQPPETLIVHVKRFAQQTGFGTRSLFSSNSLGRHSKNAAEVSVPATLDLRKFCNADGLRGTGMSGCYELVAMSEHSGSLGGGHYTATGKAVSNARWHSFNDSHVSQSGSPSGRSSTAYVLFFQSTASSRL